MQRTPEPELMRDAEQARAYANANFAAPHRFCIELLGRVLPELPRRGRVLDMGCGPGDMTFRLVRQLPDWQIDAVDGSPAMLALARADAARDGVRSVAFHQLILPRDQPPRPPYDLLFANSLLHHVADPAPLWSAMREWARPGGGIFIMDLLRPDSDAQHRGLVEQYAAGEPDVLRHDFSNSLRAAYRPGEVREQIARAGLAHLTIEIVTDRHLVVYGHN